MVTSLASLPSEGGAVLPPDEVEFVIITVTDLAPDFENLAAFKRNINISTRVVTLDWIGNNVEPGVDMPATIRGFLQEARTQWGTAYVLLGGDIDQVPTRWVHSDFFPSVSGSDLPTDLYYAGLDGDWDGDGDGIYGEPYQNASDPGDGADLGPDLAFGRAPVSSPAEAALFVEKTIVFHDQAFTIAAGRALLVAEVLFPYDWDQGPYIILDGAEYTENLHSQLLGADPPWQDDRYYENYSDYPGSMNATSTSVLGAMSTGSYRLVYSVSFAFGDSLAVGQGFITGDQLAQLNNSSPFFFVVLGSGGAAHDGNSAIVRALLAPDGGCAGGLGLTRASFPSKTSIYFESFFQYAYAMTGARVGDALVATLNEHIANTQVDYVDRWTHLSMVLLGDPTLPLTGDERVVSIGGSDDTEDDETPVAFTRASLNVLPNPFNPQLEIHGELPKPGHVRVSVSDVRGREIFVLFDGQQVAGETSWKWNGRDRTGRAVASGVYLIRLETDRRIVTRAVTLVR
jgi:hypothetical protein